MTRLHSRSKRVGALFGAFCVRADIQDVDILHPWVFRRIVVWRDVAIHLYVTGEEVRAESGQRHGDGVHGASVIEGSKEPDYEKHIVNSTRAPLNETLTRGALVILDPRLRSCVRGMACAGRLLGGFVFSVSLSISMCDILRPPNRSSVKTLFLLHPTLWKKCPHVAAICGFIHAVIERLCSRTLSEESAVIGIASTGEQGKCVFQTRLSFSGALVLVNLA